MFSVAGTSCYFYPHLGLKSKRWTEITEKADDDNGAGVYVMQCSPALEIITPSFEPRFEFDDILHICCKKKLNHLIDRFRWPLSSGWTANLAPTGTTHDDHSVDRTAMAYAVLGGQGTMAMWDLVSGIG